jgi:hypothetical protein
MSRLSSQASHWGLLAILLGAASSCGAGDTSSTEGSTASTSTGMVSSSGAGASGGGSGSGTGGGAGTSGSASTASSSVSTGASGGPCQSGAECDDGLACTADFCDLTSASCKHVPDDTKCFDGIHCNGAERCDPATGCHAGTPVNCNDDIACTTDACNEALDQCDHAPVDAACADGVFCNGQETCNPQLGCQGGAPVACDDNLSCTLDSCDEALQQCVHTSVNAGCDDGLFCNGQETCDPAGSPPSGCKLGAAVVCPSDGIACTIDACNEASKLCVSTPDNTKCASTEFCIAQQGCTPAPSCSNSAECQDGNLCNGAEACIGGLCRRGQEVNCNDGLVCTVDDCNPSTGACSHAPTNAVCDDGLICNGVESCSTVFGCIAGTPIDCSDTIACTVDLCQEPTGTCTHAPLDFGCDDNKLCNGVEICDPTMGCQPGAPFVCPNSGVGCNVEVCDPLINACKPIPHDELCPCGQTCNAQFGCGNFCSVTTCQGKVYQCGDCSDNDSDCRLDSGDTDCLGPCDNTENSYYGGIPGQNNSPCKQDCYFDADTGSGNDDCYWSHKCDPLEVSPAYPPEGDQCAYNPNASIPGTNSTCGGLQMAQSTSCSDYCGPLTPNGCDCFGCCEIPGAPTTVWLGSENPAGVGSCTINAVGDPTKCKPCTQVASCLNTCDTCEICVGQPLPPGCVSQTCPAGVQACGLPGQPACPAGFSCITGCCFEAPQ